MFSPDGNRIAFMSNLDGTDGFDLFVKTLGDDQPARSIITLNGNQRPSQWPSDTLIVFEHSSGGGAAADLWMLDLSDPDNAVAVEYLSSEANLRDIMVSPDGTLAAYTSDETGSNEVFIRSFPEPGERTPVSQGGGGAPLLVTGREHPLLLEPRRSGRRTRGRVHGRPHPAKSDAGGAIQGALVHRELLSTGF